MLPQSLGSSLWLTRASVAKGCGAVVAGGSDMDRGQRREQGLLNDLGAATREHRSTVRAWQSASRRDTIANHNVVERWA